MYVADACTIIDLHAVGLLRLWLEVAPSSVSDLVYTELVRERSTNAVVVEAVVELVICQQLVRQELTPEQLVEISALAAAHPKLSDEDLSCFVLASTDDLIVLTGDRRLRELSVRREVRVHGTLYILDQLVGLGRLVQTEAREKLQTLVELGCRLPPAEVAARRRRWGSKPN